MMISSPLGSEQTLSFSLLLCPCNLLHVVLQVSLSSSNVKHRGIERIMSHDLGESVKRNHLCHPIAEAMPEIMRADINYMRHPSIFSNQVSKCSLGESTSGVFRGKEIDTLLWKRFEVHAENGPGSGIEGYITNFVVLANDP